MSDVAHVHPRFDLLSRASSVLHNMLSVAHSLKLPQINLPTHVHTYSEKCNLQNISHRKHNAEPESL